MPFYKFDEEHDEEEEEEENEDWEDSETESEEEPDEVRTVVDPSEPPEMREGFTYESNPQERFVPDSLEGAARAAFDELRALDATSIRCSYNGGGDEGFAHFELAIIDGAPVGAGDLIRKLSNGPLSEGSARIRYSDRTQISPDVHTRDSLDELAQECAERLLGDGFGTGEYTMYGAFTADLITGEVVDIPPEE